MLVIADKVSPAYALQGSSLNEGRNKIQICAKNTMQQFKIPISCLDILPAQSS